MTIKDKISAVLTMYEIRVRTVMAIMPRTAKWVKNGGKLHDPSTEKKCRGGKEDESDVAKGDEE